MKQSINDFIYPTTWLTDRVIGQPTNNMKEKWACTYGRVINVLEKKRISKLQTLGLLATHHRAIPEFISKNVSYQLPIGHTVVVDYSPIVLEKIRNREVTTQQNCQNLTLIEAHLRSLTYQSIGRPPRSFKAIKTLQNQGKSFNFLDFDLMVNWGVESAFNYLPKILNMYATSTCIIHINAISNFPRTRLWSTSRIHIEEILTQKILKQINGTISNMSIDSYVTHNKVDTEMTSAVFAVET
jgi:hypothetical protein